MRSNTNSNHPVRRVLLECTDTYFTDRNTDVQQVVRNLAHESPAIAAECGVECQPIVRIGDRFLVLPWKPRLVRPSSFWRRPLAHWWPAKRVGDPSRILRLLRHAGRGLQSVFYPRMLVRKFTHMWWSWEGETVVAGEGDTLVLLDAWWNRNIWPTVAQSRHHGATIGVVIYDLLPITHPERFPAGDRESFTASLQIALEQGDFFIAISDPVRDALRSFAAQHGPPRKLRDASFMSFRPGSTSGNPEPAEGLSPPSGCTLLSWTESTREFLGKCLSASQRGDHPAFTSRKAA